jgi:hypothetical protein
MNQVKKEPRTGSDPTTDIKLSIPTIRTISAPVQTYTRRKNSKNISRGFPNNNVSINKINKNFNFTNKNRKINKFTIDPVLEQQLPPIANISFIQTLLFKNIFDIYKHSNYFKNMYEHQKTESVDFNKKEKEISDTLKKSFDYVYEIMDNSGFYKLNAVDRLELYKIISNNDNKRFLEYCNNNLTNKSIELFNHLRNIYSILFNLPKGSVQHEHSFSVGFTLEFLIDLIHTFSDENSLFALVYIENKIDHPHFTDSLVNSIRIVRKDIIKEIEQKNEFKNSFYYLNANASISYYSKVQLYWNNTEKKYNVTKHTNNYYSNTINIYDLENILFITQENQEIILKHPWAFLEFIADRSKGVTGNYDIQDIYLKYIAKNCEEENVQEIQIKSPITSWSWDASGNFIKKSVKETYELYRTIVLNESLPVKIRFIAGKGRGPERNNVAELMTGIYKHFETIAKLERDNSIKIISGYDVYSQEDVSNKNEKFVKLFEKLSKEYPEVQYVLHTGETNKIEYPGDHNLIYAALFKNSLRVGHAVALWKYPLLIEDYLKKNIGIELCPISNNLLGYVDDIRNHPALCYINNNLSVSINTDNRGLLNYKYVTFDWMDLCLAQKFPFVTLKNIAYKSIMQSSRNKEYNNELLISWYHKYSEYIVSPILRNLKNNKDKQNTTQSNRESGNIILTQDPENNYEILMGTPIPNITK